MTSPISTHSASAWAPCGYARCVPRRHRAPQPHGAPGAHSNARWDTSPRTQTSATPASSWRGINSKPAARAAKPSSSGSCAKTLRAAGCAMHVRRKPGLTYARHAKSTNQPRHSTTRGKTSKRLSTPAARLARRASSASVTSPTIGPWPQTHASARHARLCPTARIVGYATKRWRRRNSQRHNGSGHRGAEIPATGAYDAPGATPVPAAR